MGDTLIEVSIAIGIFSMVAISIVAVMNGGTSSSQTALETTLAREEIDTQAEALRFIQSAYIADRDSGKGAGTDSGQSIYNKAWGDIVNLAIEPTNAGSKTESYTAFEGIINNTTSCDVYSNEDFKDVFKNHAFIINPHTMKIITPGNTDGITFDQASTYPRLIMSSQINGGNTLSDSLVDNSLSGDLSRVEGLYVFAVKDADTTNITDPNNSDTSSKSAFLDFYIRACWYGNGDDTPSTISTVVRLYNPDATATASKATGVWVKFDGNGADNGSTISVFIPLVGDRPNLTRNGFSRWGYTFAGWSTSPNSTPDDVLYKDGATYTPPSSLAFNDEVTLYAIWNPIPYDLTVKFNANGGSGSMSDQKVRQATGSSFNLNANTFTSPNPLYYKFGGWSLTPDGSIQYSNQSSFTVPEHPAYPDNESTVSLYAQWTPIYLIEYETSGSSNTIATHDCDKMNGCNVTSTKPEKDGYRFIGWCSVMVAINQECSGKFYSPGDRIEGSVLKEGESYYLYAMYEVHPDTVFLLDSTGSMSNMIAASKSAIETLAKKTVTLGGKVALFDYRDLGENEYYPTKCYSASGWKKDGCVAARQYCSFSTCTVNNIGGFVQNISVNGGGDLNESMLAALYYIMKSSSWSQGYVKTIIVVTDAPYLSPDRNGVTYNDVINTAKSLDPLNIYVVTTNEYSSFYSSITSNTGGKVVIMKGLTTADRANSIINGLNDVIK